MAYRLQDQIRNRMAQSGGDDYEMPGAPIGEPQAPAAPAAPVPAPATPAAPRISSAQTGAKGVEDKWFQFLNSSGLAKGQAGNGFYTGGQGYRGNLGSVVDQFNQATGSNARAVAGRDDQIDFGSGAQDVLQAGTDNWWLSPSSGASSPAGGTGAPGGGAAGGGASGAAGGVSQFQQQIRDLLMQQLAGFSKPVDANDPSVKAEMDAQGALLERTRQERRAAAAERAAADGLLNGGQGSGAFESEVASGYEDKGQQLSGLQAKLFGREIQSRRDKVAQLLSLAMQSGDAESARALQLQMAQMDDQLQRLGLDQRQSQWDDSYGLDKSDRQYQRDRDAARAKAGLPF